jgi:hypothetical protein
VSLAPLVSESLKAPAASKSTAGALPGLLFTTTSATPADCVAWCAGEADRRGMEEGPGSPLAPPPPVVALAVPDASLTRALSRMGSPTCMGPSTGGCVVVGCVVCGGWVCGGWVCGGWVWGGG